MQNIWTRANALFFYAICALAIMCTLTALSTYQHVPSPTLTTLQVSGLERFSDYSDGSDKAIFSIDLSTDLKSIFNWNVKQIFVMVIAEYTSTTNVCYILIYH